MSFNNLRTKKARTILVAFAGSIGIIGIALILSLSNGVNEYINRTERQTLSQYPLTIERSSISFMSMMMVQTETWEPAAEGEITEVPSVGQPLSTVQTNDLISLKDYFDNERPEIYELSNGVEYSYSIDPRIYYYDKGTGDYRQVNPNDDFASMGLTSSSVFTSAYSMNVFFEMPENEALYIDQYDVKAGRWPENSREAVLVLTQNGAVSDYICYAFGLRDSDELDKMIQDFSNGLEVETDQTYYTWLYEDFMGTNFKVVPAYKYFKYDEKNKIYTDMRNNTDYMRDLVSNGYDLKIVGIVQPKQGQDIWMLDAGIYYDKNLVEELREEAEGSDVVKAQKADREVNVLTGIRFDEEESDFDMGSLFSIDEEAIQNAFVFDEDKLNIDEDAFGDMSGMDLSGAFGSAMPSLSADQIAGLLKGVDLKVDTDALGTGISSILTDYMDYASADPSTNYANLPDAMSQFISSPRGSAIIREQLIKIIQDSGAGAIDQALVNEALNAITDGFAEYAAKQGWDITDPSNYQTLFRQYLESDEGKAVVDAQSEKITAEITSRIEVTADNARDMAAALLAAYSEYANENDLPDPAVLGDSIKEYLGTERAKNLITYVVTTSVNADEITATVMKNVSGMTSSMMGQISDGIQKAITMVIERLASNMTNALKDTFEGMGSALTIDQDAFAKAFQFNMDESQLQSFMNEMMGGSGVSSAEKNLASFGYCDKEDLQSITIFPKDFESKDEIVQIIKDYNKKVEEAGEDDKNIVYTDIVGALMKSVTKIVNTISYVLIAFVSISLIVSSIMIGVITYISVLERRKEIGILRAMGASKHNVAQVFNAETIITGFLAGLLGVGISLVLLIPINALIHKLADSSDVSAVLPWNAAIILVVLSVILTLIGGLIPSKKASRQDPVTALRTE